MNFDREVGNLILSRAAFCFQATLRGTCHECGSNRETRGKLREVCLGALFLMAFSVYVSSAKHMLAKHMPRVAYKIGGAGIFRQGCRFSPRNVAFF
jgi:hypothetical protein